MSGGTTDENTIYTRYSQSDDAEWERDLVQSISVSDIGGIEFPTMPDPSIQRGLQGSDGVTSIREALMFRRYVKEILHTHAIPMTSASTLVDFGTGWGRIARIFMADVPASQIFAVEPYSPITVARKCNPYISFVKSMPLPRLPLRDELATHVVSYSTFTHFNRKFFDEWICELYRILKPNGALCVTTLGIHFLRTLAMEAKKKAAGERLHFWYELILERLDIKTMKEIEVRISNGEYVFLPKSQGKDNEEFAECFVTDEFFRKQYGEIFDVLAYAHNGEIAQDCIVLKKRNRR